jgi:hypothetical protein
MRRSRKYGDHRCGIVWTGARERAQQRHVDFLRLLEHPHFVELRAVEHVARRLAEDRRFGETAVGMADVARDELRAERLHVPEPFDRQLCAHLDHDVDVVRDVRGFHERYVEAVEFEAGGQRVRVAAVQEVDRTDAVRALEHHREIRDVLMNAVFPDCLAVTRKQRDADRRSFSASAA